ncbi:hypothetical protein ElyMa_004249200 [Elysia marginata]|uniref:Uncharacterized protein n=1 Tax=Elysia marginata TaxID=1093978 RepID=A0AAV4GRD0_9GAST|nr:hypothetical protein ElyMa_004249200 [Elysia marginata]
MVIPPFEFFTHERSVLNQSHTWAGGGGGGGIYPFIRENWRFCSPTFCGTLSLSLADFQCEVHLVCLLCPSRNILRSCSTGSEVISLRMPQFATLLPIYADVETVDTGNASSNNHGLFDKPKVSQTPLKAKTPL